MTPVRIFAGHVAAGAGRAAGFTRLPWVAAALIEHFGIDPWPGTLNLQLAGADDLWAWAAVRSGPSAFLVPPDPGGCGAHCFPVQIEDRIPGVVLLPQIEGYPPDRIELVAPLCLRETLGVGDHARVLLNASPLPPLSSLFFDVDGTLVNSLEGYREAASRAAGSCDYPVTLDAVRAALNSNASFWDLVLDGHPDHSPERIADLRAQTMHHWPSVLAERVQLFPEVAGILGRLRESGIRLGLCTGSGGESFQPLEKAGLLEYFDVVVTAKDVGRRKPHPEGLLRCLETLGAEPGASAYIGDSPLDIEAAHAAGMVAIGVLSGSGDSAQLAAAGADRLLPGIHRLPEVLGGRMKGR